MSTKEANNIIKKYLKLRDLVKVKPDPKAIIELKQQQQICLQKFRYLVLIKTSRYKNFNNYDDLNQEGLEALLQGLNSYNPKKGNIFWWLHKYIDTRISRTANLHTTIKFPLKYAKIHTPHREQLPTVTDFTTIDQSDMLEQSEALHTIKQTFSTLSDNQQNIVKLVFGMNGENPQSISKVCKQLNISRQACTQVLKQVYCILKRNIQQSSL